MNKSTILHYSIPLITTLILASTALFNSSEEQNEASSMESYTNPAYTELEPFVYWDYLRKDQALVKQLFLEAGNSFRFTPTIEITEQDTIHAYLYVDETKVNETDGFSKALAFKFIKRKDDTYNEQELFKTAPLFIETEQPAQVVSHAFDYKEEITTNNKENISLTVAEERISAWLDDDKRNRWVSQQFNTSNTNVFQVFSINGANFKKDHQYRGFFGLKYDAATDSFSADVIVANTAAIDSKRANFQDWSVPHPPFPRSQTDFKLMEEVRILSERADTKDAYITYHLRPNY